MRALGVMLLLAGQAQAADRQVQRACKADFSRLCLGTGVSGAAATACLRQSYVSLSRGCRKALDAARKAQDAGPIPSGRAPE